MISLVGLVPTSPMFIPEISGESLKAVEKTVNGFLKLVIKIHALAPDYLVLLSPEAPRLHHRFSLATGAFVGRVFSSNVQPSEIVEITFPVPSEEVSVFSSYAFQHKIQVEQYQSEQGISAIDNASLSILYYLSKVSCFPKTLLLGMSDFGMEKYTTLGDAVLQWAESMPDKKVVVLSVADIDQLDGVLASELSHLVISMRTWERPVSDVEILAQSSLWPQSYFLEGVLGKRHPEFHLLGNDVFEDRSFQVGYFE